MSPGPPAGSSWRSTRCRRPEPEKSHGRRRCPASAASARRPCATTPNAEGGGPTSPGRRSSASTARPRSGSCAIANDSEFSSPAPSAIARRASAAMADRSRRAKSQPAGPLTWIPSRTRQSSEIDSGRRAMTRFMIRSLPGAAADGPTARGPGAGGAGPRRSAWRSACGGPSPPDRAARHPACRRRSRPRSR